MGLDGIEPSASALSVRDNGLVRRLVYVLTCPFVPLRATERRVVPLRLGTLWARGGETFEAGASVRLISGTGIFDALSLVSCCGSPDPPGSFRGDGAGVDRRADRPLARRYASRRWSARHQPAPAARSLPGIEIDTAIRWTKLLKRD